jgi:aspartate racemase
MDKKILGIIGGVGPLATMLLGEMIVRRTKAILDQEHVNMVITNNTSIPDRTTYILDRSKANPVPVMISDGLKLKSIGAQVVAMPCNTAHTFAKFKRFRHSSIVETAGGFVVGSKSCILATTGTLTASVYQHIRCWYTTNCSDEETKTCDV